MDCLIAVPSGDRGALQLAAPTAAALAPPCMAGSPLTRSSMFMPRLHSIPEAAEPSTAAEEAAVRVACAAAAGNDAPAAPSSNSQDAACCSQQAAEASSSSPTDAVRCSTPAAGEAEGCEQESGCEPDDIHPAVVASTWAVNMRHFTDCIPLTAETVCSTSTCHSLSIRGSGEPCSSSSPRASRTQTATCSSNSQQQQQLEQTRAVQLGQCHTASCCSVPHSSSSSSLLPAAADDGVCSTGSAVLSGLDVLDIDATEWQPWDRVAQWLEANSQGAQPALQGTAAIRNSHASSSNSCGVAAGAVRDPTSVASQQHQQQVSEQQLRTCSSQGAQQQQQQCSEVGGDGTELFDAPDWWQESVKARLAEQREAFHSSWWCRFKILTGLAAQRAACSLQV